MSKILAQHVYSDDEIIKRIIDAAAPVSGPTDYMVEINYIAPNDCEPPIITARIIESRKDVLCHIDVDQNTTLDFFKGQLREFCKVVDLCRKAYDKGTSYREELSKCQENEPDGDFPF